MLVFRLTDLARVNLQIEVVGFDHVTDDTLEGVPNVDCMLGAHILHSNAEIHRMVVDDVLKRAGLHYVFADGDLKAPSVHLAHMPCR